VGYRGERGRARQQRAGDRAGQRRRDGPPQQEDLVSAEACVRSSFRAPRRAPLRGPPPATFRPPAAATKRSATAARPGRARGADHRRRADAAREAAGFRARASLRRLPRTEAPGSSSRVIRAFRRSCSSTTRATARSGAARTSGLAAPPARQPGEPGRPQSGQRGRASASASECSQSSAAKASVPTTDALARLSVRKLHACHMRGLGGGRSPTGRPATWLARGG
jgi:hypothetical protein